MKNVYLAFRAVNKNGAKRLQADIFDCKCFLKFFNYNKMKFSTFIVVHSYLSTTWSRVWNTCCKLVKIFSKESRGLMKTGKKGTSKCRGKVRDKVVKECFHIVLPKAKKIIQNFFRLINSSSKVSQYLNLSFHSRRTEYKLGHFFTARPSLIGHS